MSDHLAETISALWPTHKLPAPVVAELTRRANALPLSVEQIRARLTNYRIACGRYEQVSPDPGNIEKELRAAAFGDKVVKSPGSSEYQPTPLSGPPMGFREFCRHAGEPVHPMLATVCGRTPEENERIRREREKARLAGYRRRA